MVRSFLSLFSALTLVLSLSVPAVAGPYKSGDKTVSRAQLLEHGPILLKINDKISIRILSVTYKADPGRNFKLLLPSVQQIVSARATKNADFRNQLSAGAKLKIILKSSTDSKGELICVNEGEGCVAEIEMEI